MKKHFLALTLSVLSFATLGVACTQSDDTPTKNPDDEQEKAVCQIENGGFETGNFEHWTIQGTAFAVDGLSDKSLTDDDQANNKSGNYYYTKYKEEETGVLLSSPFKIGGSGYATFKLGGAMNDGLTYLSVVDAETENELFRFGNSLFTEQTADVLQAYKVDLRKAMGKWVRLKIVDNSTANYGYICFDDFVTYYECAPVESFTLAEDIKPIYHSASATSSFIRNADFSSELKDWQTTGERDCFKVGHISNGRISNKDDFNAVGVLRSSSFTVSGQGIISYRLGMTKDPALTYLSVRKSGTNEEIFRTYSDRWKTSHGESTHLYYLDLSKIVRQIQII